MEAAIVADVEGRGKLISTSSQRRRRRRRQRNENRNRFSQFKTRNATLSLSLSHRNKMAVRIGQNWTDGESNYTTFSPNSRGRSIKCLRERRYFQKGEEEEDNSRSFARSCCCCSQSICDLLAHSFLENGGMTVTVTSPSLRSILARSLLVASCYHQCLLGCLFLDFDQVPLKFTQRCGAKP